MIVEIIAVCLLAKFKRFKLHYLFRTWTFYPILLMQCVLVVFQASLFFRQYVFVRFVPYTEMAVILSFLFALLAFKLYTPAIVGSASIGVGTLLNKLVIAGNAGKMPVYPTLSYLTGYVTPEMLTSLDSLHSMGGPETKLKFLSDYIDFGYCILSPGDLLIHLFACIMLYALIKAVNARYGNQSR
jgi:hypothetical protein